MSLKCCLLKFLLDFIAYNVYASFSLIVKFALNNKAFVDMKQENTYAMHTISF